MKHLLVVSCFLLILSTSINRVFAQQTIPEGTKIALVTDLNRWATVCKDCQKLKYTSINLTVTSNTSASSRKPNKESIYTVEYQDGKIRLRTYAGTYLSVCGDCRKKGPSFLLVASMKKKSNGKVPRYSLFDFIPVKDSDFYMIKTYNGKYITRYHPGNDRPDMLKGKSQVLAGYYGKTDRRAGKFNVIALNKSFSRGFVAGNKIPKAVRHADIIGFQWMTQTSITKNSITYIRKSFANQEIYAPTIPCFGTNSDSFCRTYIMGNTSTINERSKNISLNFIYKIEYFGADAGYRITANGRVLSPIMTSDTTPYFDNVLGQLVVFEKLKNTSLLDQFWNIEKINNDFYILQNRASGLYLGTTGNSKNVLVNKKDALPIAFETYMLNELPKTYENGYTFNTIDVPNSNEMVVNPLKLPFRTWLETKNAFSQGNFSYLGYDDWQIATRKKVEEITKKFQNTLSENYLDLFSLSRFFYVTDWTGNAEGQLTIHRKGNTHYTFGNLLKEGKVVLWREK
ncbi:hypothetical protein C8N46_107169 [Kordia periserrulae]|uniref:WG repeat protein n=1 Tax=Kordia periserrulae TaxID=701523 RepID=A0A2T6BVS5_9FLAO|nr:RICIN domain-containing protein [Kordia periserrulae]PTX60163.1 hypothetical protein C8N46_107169 [Kordia periserrulae]